MLTTLIATAMLTLAPMAGHIVDVPQSPMIASADDNQMGTCLEDMSAEWRPCQFDPSLPIQEDDPRWSCVADGNRICGPDNSNGVPAGCYDDGGAMVAAWPCSVVVDSNGDANVYTPDAR